MVNGKKSPVAAAAYLRGGFDRSIPLGLFLYI